MSRLYMTIGLPGSGKSTWAGEQNIPVFSSDDLRKELLGDISRQDKNDLIFNELNKRIMTQLKIGDAIYDATNLNARKRSGFLRQLSKDTKKIAVLFATDFNTVTQQNKMRKRQVPHNALLHMRETFQTPAIWEGWDEIEVIWNVKQFSFSWSDYNISQDNSHHSLRLDEHLRKTAYLLSEEKDICLRVAALLHDIGKIHTKKFENIKGNPTNDAHYYNHQGVGAYESLFAAKNMYFNDEMCLQISAFVCWHMQPYFLETEKSIQKWVGDCHIKKRFWDKLLLLNMADRQAH